MQFGHFRISLLHLLTNAKVLIGWPRVAVNLSGHPRRKDSGEARPHAIKEQAQWTLAKTGQGPAYADLR